MKSEVITPCILTFGHSTMYLGGAAAQLRAANVEVLIDVRSHPTSRWPQFQQEQLARWLPQEGIGYEWWPALGGWDVRHAEDEELRARMMTVGVDLAVYSKGKFPKQIIAQALTPDPDNPTWYNRGLMEYSWFMTTEEFLKGANSLLDRGSHERVAICCAEAVPWRCHRSMVCDYLAWRGADSFHLLGKNGLPHSKMLGNRLERYDLRVIQTWIDTLCS